ncbi:HD domain-containing protein [bacterium]|nr:MAG: HD domain-containing protein [bacterium]
MQNLTKLFKLLQLTRSQPQYGYGVRGISTNDLSNLAEHQYLTSIIAWQLARRAKEAGANISIEKVLEFSLLHDLGELFGSDISAPYAKINRRAYKAAKAFELENQRFLAKFFGKDEKYFKKIAGEILDAKSDEALLAKTADWMECTHYLFWMGKLEKSSVDLANSKIESYAKKMRDPIAKEMVLEFLKIWVKEIEKGSIVDIISDFGTHAR